MPDTKKVLDNWKGILVSLAAVIIVVPSVINGIGDVLVALRGLPVGTKEKINKQLFETHWKENPVHTKQIVIEGGNGKIPITVDIYKNGDIFVDYGRLTQWFPYSYEIAQTDFSFVTSAYAGFFDKITRSIKSLQKESITNVKKSSKTVERTRTYEDGSKEVQVIDINTGEIKSVKQIGPNVESRPKPPSLNDTDLKIEVIKLPETNKDKVQIYQLDPESK